MRIRNRSLATTPVPVGPFTVSHYNPINVLINGPTSGLFPGLSPISLTDGHEQIEDADPTSRKGVNEVIHVSQKIEREDISLTDEVSGSNRYIYNGPQAHWFSWGAYGQINLSDITVAYNRPEQALITDTISAFHNENEVDNLLNLVEAPQLLPSLKDFASRTKSLGKGNPEDWRQFLRRLARVGSGGLLVHSFGVAPLISDMLEMRKALPKIRQGFKRAQRESNGVITVRRKSVGKPTLTPTALGMRTSNTLDGNWWTPLPNWEDGPKNIAVVVGKRDRPRYYSSTLNKVDDLLRKYLSAGPASAVWEALPFSFVVDWFVDTSRVIDSLNESLTGLSSSLIRLSYSEKFDVKVAIQKLPTTSWTSDSDYKITARNTLKYYHRKSVQPSNYAELSGRFGKKQLALSGALLHEIVANLQRAR